MTCMQWRNALCLAICVVATPLASWADAGHDHGASAPAQDTSGLPRFSAVSETFELVGVLNGKQLSLYLDRADDNSPVRNAQLELELGGVKLELKALGEGEFGATLAQQPKVGVTAVSATVVAGQESDLLAADLLIRDQATSLVATPQLPWRTYGAWAAGTLLALGLLAGGWRMNRSKRTGGTR